MDSRIKYFREAILQQGKGFDNLVIVWTAGYQNGQGLGDVLHGILKFIPKSGGLLLNLWF